MAEKKFFVDINLQGSNVTNLKADTLDITTNSAASNTKRIVYHNGQYYYSNGTSWILLSSNGSLPTGGAAGQILAKASSTDYDAEWINNYLKDLADVSITGRTNNTILGYNSSTNLNEFKTISDWLDYTPANKAGETFTGAITATNLSGTNTGDETNTSIKYKLGSATSSNDGYLTSTDWSTFNNKVSSSLLGASNGVATLDSGGKVPSSQLPSSVMNYHGTYDIVTNTPALSDGMVGADPGDVYICSTAGTRNFGSGDITVGLGDWLIYSQASIWEKSDNSDAVVSVNGYTGVVSLGVSDISGAIGGSGTTNYISKFTGSGTLGNSLIYDNGTQVGIGTITPIGATNYISLNIGDNDASKTGLLKFSSTYNNGNGAEIYQSASGTTLFNVNSSLNGFIIDSEGNMGVGNSISGLSPLSAKLHVNNIGTGNSFLVEDSSNPDPTPFIVDANGNVGIGDTPSAKLEIFNGALGGTTGDYLASQIINIANANSEVLELGSLRTSSGSNWETSSFRIQEKIDSLWMGFIQFNGTGNSGGIQFGTGTEPARQDVPTRMTINATGNVGIGVTNPGYKLDVAGEIAIRGTSDADDARMYFQAADNSNRFTIETDFDPAIEIDKLGFRSILTDNILVLQGDGNVGIGTTSQFTKLTVDGTISLLNTLNSTNGSVYIDHPGVTVWNMGITSTNTSTFHIGNGAAFANKILNITNDGKMGIGQTAPTTTLDVNGDAKIATIANATTNTGKILVSDGGVVKYRTAAETISDILTVTNTGTSGAATLTGTTLNIPVYEESLIPKLQGNEIWRGATFRNNVTTVDTTGGITLSASGTATAKAVASTSYATRSIRLNYNSAVSVQTGRYTGIRGSALLWYVTGGFLYTGEFNISDTSTAVGTHNFWGLASSTSDLVIGGISNDQPSALTNIIAFANDSGDSNLQIMHNDASGVATKTDLGSSFPSNRTAGAAITTIYSCYLYNAPNSSDVIYRIVNKETGVVAQGTLSTNLPASTVGLNFFGARTMGTSGGGVTQAGQFDVYRLGVYSL